MQAFVDIYSGPIFFVHYKYSYILTVVYIAFMFGPLMPILFLSATASLGCLYIVEKMCMGFAYRKPPMYDDELIRFVLKMLSYAPLLYALMACWVFSNQQVFRNKALANEGLFLYPATDHDWHQAFY